MNVILIVLLNRVVEGYEKGQVGLESVLSGKRYYNDKSGLSYSKIDKPSTSKSIFVKTNDKSNKERVKNVHFVHHHLKKNFGQNKSYIPRYRSNFFPTCFYYGLKGHTPNACYIKNFSVPMGHYVWIKKRTN